MKKTDEQRKQETDQSLGSWSLWNEGLASRWAHVGLNYPERSMEALACVPAGNVDPQFHVPFFIELFTFCIYLSNYSIHVSRVIFKLFKNWCINGTDQSEQIQSEWMLAKNPDCRPEYKH